MKKILFFLLLVLINVSCFELFNKNERLINSYKLNNSNDVIELYFIGLGTTTNNVIEIRKTNSSQTKVIKKIKGPNDTYKVDIQQINDTLIKIVFTDTVGFKGAQREFVVNVSGNDSLEIVR